MFIEFKSDQDIIFELIIVKTKLIKLLISYYNTFNRVLKK